MDKATQPVPNDLLAEAADFMRKPRPRTRDSVRTTFKLSPEALQQLDWLANHLGITRKETFDELSNFLVSLDKDIFLVYVNKNAEKLQADQQRKTYVISDQARKALEQKSKEYQLSRDDLLENIIPFTKSLFEFIEKQRLLKHKEAMEKINAFWGEAEDMERVLSQLLDDNDPIKQRFGMVVTHLMALSLDIEAELKDGTPIDPW